MHVCDPWIYMEKQSMPHEYICQLHTSQSSACMVKDSHSYVCMLCIRMCDGATTFMQEFVDKLYGFLRSVHGLWAWSLAFYYDRMPWSLLCHTNCWHTHVLSLCECVTWSAAGTRFVHSSSLTGLPCHVRHWHTFFSRGVVRTRLFSKVSPHQVLAHVPCILHVWQVCLVMAVQVSCIPQFWQVCFAMSVVGLVFHFLRLWYACCAILDIGRRSPKTIWKTIWHGKLFDIGP